MSVNNDIDLLCNYNILGYFYDNVVIGINKILPDYVPHANKY